MKAIEVWPVAEEDAQNIDELKETFPDKADLRAALEDYFHIYDDWAEMTPIEFDTYFEEYMKEPINSSKIGKISDDFRLGNITEKQAIINLIREGKSKKLAQKIVDDWKSQGLVMSSFEKAIKKLGDYFGTTPSGDTINCDDVLSLADEYNVKEIAKTEGVQVQIGKFSVRVIKPIESSRKIIKSSLIDEFIDAVGRLKKTATREDYWNAAPMEKELNKVIPIVMKSGSEKDPRVRFDGEKYTIDGIDAKRYVIERLGENYFEENWLWDSFFEYFDEYISEFAPREEPESIKSNFIYEIYKPIGNGEWVFVDSADDPFEAMVLKRPGYIVKRVESSLIKSNIVSRGKYYIEINKDGENVFLGDKGVDQGNPLEFKSTKDAQNSTGYQKAVRLFGQDNVTIKQQR